jgi:hypothetical protein
VESISIRTERERRGRGGSSDFKSNWTRIEMAGRSAGPLVAGCRCLIVSHRPRRHQSARFSFSLSLLLLPFDLLKPHPSPSFARSTARREGRRTTKRRPAASRVAEKVLFLFDLSHDPPSNLSRMDKAPGDVERHFPFVRVETAHQGILIS